MNWKNPKLIQGFAGALLLIVAAGVWLGKGTKTTAGEGRALLKKYAPDYATFAETSSKIEGKEIRQALQESLDLAKSTQDETLRAFTLVRIAFLYQSLGEKDNERKAWQAIEAMAGNKNIKAVEKTFVCEGSGLNDYIRYRLNALNQR